MKTGEAIQTVGVAIAALAIAARFYESTRTERRRTQPVVILHERRGRQLDAQRVSGDPRGWIVGVWLTNDGLGPAFNVRFGVEYHRVRIANKLENDDPDSGNRHRVLREGERLPDDSAMLPMRIPSLAVLGTVNKGDPDPGRVYWCRYENVTGQTWETRNPGDRSSDLEILRVRAPRLRQWWEVWRYRRLLDAGNKQERAAADELLSSPSILPEDSQEPQGTRESRT